MVVMMSQWRFSPASRDEVRVPVDTDVSALILQAPIATVVSPFIPNQVADTAPSLAIVTAFSENHKMLGIAMLQTLVQNEYKGSIYIYLIPRETDRTEWMTEWRNETLKSPLHLHFVEMPTPHAMDTYCFKPQAIQQFLLDAQREHRLPRIIFWADVSTRFMEDPTPLAEAIWKDGVDFVGRYTQWNVAEQTHDATFSYFGAQSREDYRHDLAIAATHFALNLNHTQFVEEVLQPWMRCGVDSCLQCMAPLGSAKYPPETEGKTHEMGSATYLGHRQDQSVLNLLLYKYWRAHPATSKIHVLPDTFGASSEYFHVRTNRGPSGPYRATSSLTDWEAVPKNKD